MFGNKCQSIIRAKKIDHTFVFICYSFNVFYIIKKRRYIVEFIVPGFQNIVTI